MSEMWNDPNLVALRESLYTGWGMDVPERPEDVNITVDPNFGQPAGGGAQDDGGGDGDGIPSGPSAYEQWLMDQQAAAEQNRIKNASATMKALLESYNLTTLYNTVLGYIKEGYDADAIGVLIRTTPEYKQRFPAMEALSKKGRAISEGDYIQYEQTAAGLERRYGLPQGMLMGKVTDLLTNEVSPTELNDRVILASSAAIQAPAEIKTQFQQYYGIDQGGLTAYFLDPTVATPLLEKQYASTLIGAEATRQGVGLDVYGAENLQALGISQEQAREGFGVVRGARGLTAGRGDVTSEKELIAGTLGGSEEARKNIERAAQGRLGRFQGGGEFLQTAQGAAGLGTAATR